MMKYAGIIISLFIILSMSVETTASPGKKALRLRDITDDNNYQLKVRTGNLAVDRNVYNAAYEVLSSYLPISDEEQYTGYIEVRFSSTAGQGFLGSKPAYKNNVIYGTRWFTGAMNSDFQSPIESESNEVDILRWQKSQMIVTIKNLKGNKLWSGQYTYKGMQDITGLMNKINEGANLCLDRIVSKFKSDFNIDQKPSKKLKMKFPPIALVVKSRWSSAGKNNLGHIVYFDSQSILHPSDNVVRVWAKTTDNEYEYLDLVDVNCSDKRFRYLEGRRDKNPALYPHTYEWTLISPDSTADRLLLSLCP